MCISLIKLTKSLPINKRAGDIYVKLRKKYLEFLLIVIIVISWSISILRYWIVEDITASTPDAASTYFILADGIHSLLAGFDLNYLEKYMSNPTSRRIVYPFILASMKLFLPFLSYNAISFIISVFVSIIIYVLMFKLTKFFVSTKEERFFILFFFISLSPVTFHISRPITDMTALMFALFAIYHYFSYKKDQKNLNLLILFGSTFLAILTREVFFILLVVFLFAPTNKITRKRRFLLFGIPIISALILIISIPSLFNSVSIALPLNLRSISAILNIETVVRELFTYFFENQIPFLISDLNTYSAISTSFLLSLLIISVNLKEIMAKQKIELLIFTIVYLIVYFIFFLLLWNNKFVDRFFLPFIWLFPMFLPICFSFNSSNIRKDKVIESDVNLTGLDIESFSNTNRTARYILITGFILVQFSISILRIINPFLQEASIIPHLFSGFMILLYFLIYSYFKFYRS